MTKTEKKKIIASLLDEIISLTDTDLKNSKLSKVASEIRSAGYKPKDFDRVNTIVDKFTTDFKTHSNDKSFLQSSGIGLITCIDWSLLSD
jgi:hypothetical protein